MKNLNEKIIGIIVICILSLFTIEGFGFHVYIFYSIIIISTIFLCILNMGNFRKFSLEEILWLFPILVMVGWSKSVTTDSIRFFVFFICGILIMISTKNSNNQYKIYMKINYFAMKVIFISVLFEYFFLSEFKTYLLPLMKKSLQESIIYQINRGNYYGITNDRIASLLYSVISIGILIFSYNIINIKKRENLIWIIASLITILFMGSRSVFIIIPISIFTVFFVNCKNTQIINRIFKTIVCIIGIVIILIILMKFFPNISGLNRIVDTISNLNNNKNISSGRDILFNIAWNGFLEKPILGNGWLEYINKNVGIIDKGVVSYAHNTYLQLLYEVGVIGFFLYNIPYIYIYIKTIKFLRILVKKTQVSISNEKQMILYSLYFQTYFLLNSFLHASYYNISYTLNYFLAISMFVSAKNQIKNKFYLMKKEESF